jgi:membrane-bound lytic murein transglycosylase A
MFTPSRLSAVAVAGVLLVLGADVGLAQQDLPSFVGDGRNSAHPALTMVFTPGIASPDADSGDGQEQRALRNALETQGQLLAKANQTQPLDLPGVGRAVSNGDLAALIPRLVQALDGGRPIAEVADAYLLQGDGQGNVRFTSYFTPTLAVSPIATDRYRVPVYRKPAGDTLPTRKEIDAGALAGRGLELAWTDSAVDLFFLQVQGSGYGQYEDGRRTLFSYGGKNGHPYASIGKYLVAQGEIPVERISMASIRQWLAAHPDRQREVLEVNSSYNFFVAGGAAVIGSGGVPLTPMRSVAADSAILPLGSVIMIEMPILAKDGTLDHHEARMMVVQDRGGAIKGTNRIDIYAGGGGEAAAFAGQMKHFGRVWLLLPKQGA